jgi:hypothetical protein
MNPVPPASGQTQPSAPQVPAVVAYRGPQFSPEEGVWSMPPYILIFPPVPPPAPPNLVMGRNSPGVLAHPPVIGPKVTWLPPPLAQTYNFSAATQVYPL